MNPKFVETCIVHEKNNKDEILICHLIQVAPWKARHGQVKSTWEKVMNGILLEKILSLRVVVVTINFSRTGSTSIALSKSIPDADNDDDKDDDEDAADDDNEDCNIISSSG